MLETWPRLPSLSLQQADPQRFGVPVFLVLHTMVHVGPYSHDSCVHGWHGSQWVQAVNCHQATSAVQLMTLSTAAVVQGKQYKTAPGNEKSAMRGLQFKTALFMLNQLQARDSEHWPCPSCPPWLHFQQDIILPIMSPIKFVEQFSNHQVKVDPHTWTWTCRYKVPTMKWSSMACTWLTVSNVIFT